MKLLNLTIFSTLLIVLFSGCVGEPSPSDKPVVDSTLPVITLTESGVFTDMKAIGFEWNSISDPRVKGVYIFKQTMGDQNSVASHYKTINNRFVTHYVDADVEPNSEYSYFFKTFSKESESAASKTYVVKTLPILNSVSWIFAKQDMPRTAKIIWRPHSNQIVKEYILERKTLEEDEWSELATIKGRLNAEYIDNDLKDNYVYKYRIRVVTYNGITSNPSKEAKVVTKALPKSVENIVATKNLPKKIKVTWNPTKQLDFDHYNVYRASSIDGSYDLVKSLKETEFTEDFQEDGENHFYRVSVVDKDDLESEYEKISAYGQTLAKPETPSLVEAVMVGDNLELKWRASDSRIKSYVVVKKASKGWFSGTPEEFVDIKSKAFVDTAIEPETTYYYTVYSTDKYNIRSKPSIEVKYTTTKDEGKIVKKVDNAEQSVKKSTQDSIEVQKAPQDGDSKIVPMEDLDMSVN
jgi:fibronectin type 3 domain-containing protein